MILDERLASFVEWCAAYQVRIADYLDAGLVAPDQVAVEPPRLPPARSGATAVPDAITTLLDSARHAVALHRRTKPEPERPYRSTRCPRCSHCSYCVCRTQPLPGWCSSPSSGPCYTSNQPPHFCRPTSARSHPRVVRPTKTCCQSKADGESNSSHDSHPGMFKLCRSEFAATSLGVENGKDGQHKSQE